MRAPPFEVTPAALEALSAIERLIGRLEGLQAPRPQPKLRKANRIRTVHGSVGIEGNALSVAQITAVLDGKRVLGLRREILEVKNAIAAYELAPQLKPNSCKDLLEAHAVLMRGLLPDAGRFRGGAVGVLREGRVAHVAPPAGRVEALVTNLLRWVRASPMPLLVKAMVGHYELVFIHPFTDGNGRVARLWQHVALLKESAAFEFVPVESIIRDRQAEYYAAIGRSNKLGKSTPFLEFSLQALKDALEELMTALRPEPQTAKLRLQSAHEAFGSKWFTRADYLRLHKLVSTATASRDLRQGSDANILKKRGDRRLAQYRFR